MADNEKELLIKISTEADTSGVKEQIAAQKELAVSASKTNDAIAVSLAKQEVAEKNATAESRAAMQEQAQAALRQIRAQEELKRSSKGAADGLHGLAKETKELSGLGHEAQGVLEGLSRGGLDGVAQAGLNASKVIKTITTSALGIPFLGAVAAASAALLALRTIFNDTEKANAREVKQATAAIEAQKVALEGNRRAAEESLKKQLEIVNQLTTAWGELDTAVDNAHKRFAAIDAAKQGTEDAALKLQESRALAGAKTPEEEESIKRRFSGVRDDLKNKRAGRALDLEEEAAKRAKETGQTVITDSDSKVRGAQNRVDEKQAAFDRAKQFADGLERGSPAGIDAREAARVAEDALKKEQEDFKKVLESMTAAIRAAEQKIADANVTLEVLPEKRKALTLSTAADATERANESKKRVNEFSKPVAEIDQRIAGSKQQLAGLEGQKDRETELGGKKETVAAIEALKAQIAQDEAAKAEAVKALAIVQKEAETNQIKQTTEAAQAQAVAAKAQLASQESYHKNILATTTASTELLRQQAKEIEELRRTVMRLAARKN